MKMITGFLTPTSGKISVAGDDVGEKPLAVKRRIGYLPEGAPAYSDMTVRGFLEFVAEVRGFRGQEKARRVVDVMERVNLIAVSHQTIETLSKGFQRRVGLAQAIIHDPEVLILDEPTDGLDPNQKHEVRNLIREMAKEKVIILSTHILEEVDAVCSRAIIIADGKILADGTPAELQARSPDHHSVTLTINAAEHDPGAVEAALSRVEDVERVVREESDSATLAYLLRAKKGSRIIAKVSDLAHSKAWEIEGLHEQIGRLDEVFRQVTTA